MFWRQRSCQPEKELEDTKGNGVDDKPVHINDGITTLQEGDTLKLLCGKAFSIDFPKTATSKEILGRSFTKHACHNSDDIDITFSSFYELFYPDGVIVSRLRETNEPFVLYQYEKEVGRSYNRINFLYLKEDPLLWKDANAHGKYTTKRCQDTFELSDGNSIPCGERNYSQLNAASIRSTTTFAKCEALQRCLADETCDPSKDDDAMEVLSSLKCFRAGSKENLKDIADQLAHQELIQRPKYAYNSWAPIISQWKTFTKIETLERMMSMYEEAKPTPRKW